MPEPRLLRRPQRIPLNRQEESLPEVTAAIWRELSKLRPFQRELVISRIKEMLREAREEEVSNAKRH